MILRTLSEELSCVNVITTPINSIAIWGNLAQC